MRAFLLPLIAMSLSGAELKIDHVTIAGRDLAKMRAALAAAGLESQYGGRHANHATEMAITSFPDGSYLELIALQADADPKAVAAHYWSRELRNDAGPAAWAVRVADLEAERQRLRAVRVAVGEPERTGRTRADGVRLDWESAAVGEERRGAFFPFLIRDITPREQRAFIGGKPTTTDLLGVARVVISTRDLKASIARFQSAYGWAAPAQRNDAKLGARVATFGDGPVALASPLDAKSWLAARLEQFGEGPCAFIFRAQKARAEVSWLDTGALGWRLAIE